MRLQFVVLTDYPLRCSLKQEHTNKLLIQWQLPMRCGTGTCNATQTVIRLRTKGMRLQFLPAA